MTRGAPNRPATWQERLATMVDLMRDMSRQTDPQKMVEVYGERIRRIRGNDGFVSLSRRGLPGPKYRVTRSGKWVEDINPWKEKDRLPIFDRGLLGELIYGDEPVLIDDLRVAADDPGAEFLDGFRSLAAIPLYDHGTALNMVVLLKHAPAGFNPEELPEMVQMSNLFGRATHNLVLSDEVRRAYELVERELRVVAEIQRSLLPAELPDIPTMELAVHYETSAQAGGDYYDFFPLPDGSWGLFIADVTGHGTPAAVLMAITHAIAHTYPGPPAPPGKILEFLNRKLVDRYTNGNGTFVTAFYGIYHPRTREFRYSCAGHNPPRIKSCDDGSMASLDAVRDLPLGIEPSAHYEEATYQFRPGDQVIFYTDGITEAFNRRGEMFGVERLDAVLGACRPHAQALIQAVLDDLQTFGGDRPADDDRTILVAKIK